MCRVAHSSIELTRKIRQAARGKPFAFCGCVMNKRLVPVVLVVLLTSRAALASDASGESDPLDEKAINASLTWVDASARMYGTAPGLGAYETLLGLQLAANYRFARRWSAGLVGSYWSGEFNNIGRLAAEARFDVLRYRFFDGWIVGEAGMAMSKHVIYGCGDCTPDQPHTGFGPTVGLGAGADFVPIPYASLGLEARMLGSAFTTTAEQYTQAGLTPSYFAGIRVSLHLPLGQ